MPTRHPATDPTDPAHLRAGHRARLLRVAVVAGAAALTLGGVGGLAAPATATVAGRPVTGSTTVPLPNGLQPEGITSAGTTYWVGSLADGRIVTGDLRQRTPATVLLPGAAGRQLRGLQYDPSSKLLWAVGNVGTVAHVWAVDTRTGAIASDTVVPGGGFLNDLVLDRDAVWVTDSDVERLTRIAITPSGRPTGAAPTFLPLSGAWPGARGGLSANGIQLLDATHVLLDHSTAGGLWAVDLTTGVAADVPVSGGPAITGGDGIEERGSTYFIVRGTSNTSVAELRITRAAGGWTATWRAVLTDPTLDVPSTATWAAGALWAVNARFGTPSPATATYYVTRLG